MRGQGVDRHLFGLYCIAKGTNVDPYSLTRHALHEVTEGEHVSLLFNMTVYTCLYDCDIHVHAHNYNYVYICAIIHIHTLKVHTPLVHAHFMYLVQYHGEPHCNGESGVVLCHVVPAGGHVGLYGVVAGICHCL